MRMVNRMRLNGLPASSVASLSPGEIGQILDNVAAFTRQLFTRAADVFMDASDDPAQALHEALGSLLRDLAGAPEMTYMSTAELPRLGPLVHDRQHRMLELFADFLQPGFAARGVALPNPEIVSLCITGGLWRIVRQHAVDRRLQELPESLPAISYVVLSTFFGVEEALRVTSAPTRTPTPSSWPTSTPTAAASKPSTASSTPTATRSRHRPRTW
jgi:hypothetical protein